MKKPKNVPYSPSLWQSLRPIWAELLDRSGDPSAFLSTRWMDAWFAVFGETARPAALVWKDTAGNPVGIVLLSLRRGRLGPVPVTRAFLNASGTPVFPEHNDVLCDPEYRKAVLVSLADVVRRTRADELALVGFREASTEALRADWPTGAWEGYFSEAPYVDLARIRAGGGAYLATLSSNSRAQIRRSIRLYEERFGPPELEVSSTPEGALEWLDEMIVLHERRWRERALPGAFANEEVRRFHTRLVRAASGDEDGEGLKAELVRIRFGEETLGVLYNLTFRGRVNFYQSGLCYHDDSRLKPGLVAHALAIEHYLARGERQYDFLGGEPEAVQYKRSLSNDCRMLAWIELPAPTLKVRSLLGLRRLRRRILAWRAGEST